MKLELGPAELCRRCDPDAIPFASTADVQPELEILGQERALEAARFAIGIRREGYHLFALGPEGVGKETILRQLLVREAARQPPPPDWCYVYNFAEPRRPRALSVPSGTASRLRADLARAIAELRLAVPAAFESEDHRGRKHRLVHDLKRRQEAAIEALQARAKERGVAVIRTESGMALAPMRGDATIDADAFEHLPEAEQAGFRAAMEAIGAEVAELFRQFHDWVRENVAAQEALDHELVSSVARGVFLAPRAAWQGTPGVLAYLAEVEADVTANAERFLDRDEAAVPDAIRRALHQHDEDDERLHRYEVNVLIDHGTEAGAPVTYEEHPTHPTLLGRIEHVSELGALVTEFRLIRPGALHRANGGYLLVDALQLLRQPLAWEALKRALRTREIRIESLGHALGVASTVTLEPDPIPLDTKVVLLGDRLVYYLLATLDPEFNDLFKVMADFEQAMDRRADTDATYALLLAGIVRREGLRAFDRGAIARVVEHAARLANDAQKLSIHLRSIVALLVEADDVARRADAAVVSAAHVQAAVDAQLHRAGRMRERMLEAIRREIVLIETTGEAIGQVNALSVVELGGFAFAYPTRITARTWIGGGDLIDIEREVELGGPIHSKGVLILGGVLGARYAQHVPLTLSASIVFEQSYAGVEGDSASLAELCALVSSIAELPLKQDVAITGSVNQQGDVQPIGGVNEKIEGFFDVCRERGLTGTQRVIIPRANVQHLMLRADVVAAVTAGQFHVHAVATLDEALAIVTGREAGSRAAEGRYPPGTVNGLVEARLARYAEDARRFMHDEERPHHRRGPRWTVAARNRPA